MQVPIGSYDSLNTNSEFAIIYIGMYGHKFRIIIYQKNLEPDYNVFLLSNFEQL